MAARLWRWTGVRILFSGEGPTDQGRLDDRGNYIPGPATVYLRRLLVREGVDGGSIAFDLFDRKEEKRRRGRSLHLGARVMQAKGHGMLAALLLLQAEMDEYDLAVFYVDADKPDKPHDSSSCTKRWTEVVESVRTAQPDGLASSVPLLPCVPMKMIECWLLADKAAIQAVPGARGSDKERLSTPAKPELIWGDRHDPEGDYPKCILSRALDAVGLPNDAPTFSEIAESADLEVLVRACPISFAPFASEVGNLVDRHHWDSWD